MCTVRYGQQRIGIHNYCASLYSRGGGGVCRVTDRVLISLQVSFLVGYNSEVGFHVYLAYAMSAKHMRYSRLVGPLVQLIGSSPLGWMYESTKYPCSQRQPSSPVRFGELDSRQACAFSIIILHHTTKEKMIQFTRELKQHGCHGGYNGKHVGDAHVLYGKMVKGKKGERTG